MIGRHMTEFIDLSCSVGLPHLDRVLAGESVRLTQFVDFGRGRRKVDMNFIPTRTKTVTSSGSSLLTQKSFCRKRHRRRRPTAPCTTCPIGRQHRSERAMSRPARAVRPTGAGPWRSTDPAVGLTRLQSSPGSMRVPASH
jgi:hypothetical protein